MHSTRGWVGQTFALAKCNDSGGRKSRIRRSKEERKEMVESFIKRYQKSNNGSFPSLNLTHKEVGGSFYTVREIVREIIQENRVLGPPKLSPEELNMDRFLEQCPLGSISVDPQIQVVSSNENELLLNHHRVKSEEQVLDSRPIPEPQHWRLDNDKIVNGSPHIASRNEEFEEPIYADSQVKRVVIGEKDEEEELEAYQSKISHITEDVVVETFPLRPVSKTVFDLDGKLSELEVLVGTLEEKDTGNMEQESGINNDSVPDRIDFLENSSEMVDMKAEADLAGPLSDRNCILVDEKAEPINLSTTKESIVLDVEVKDTLPAGNKPMNAPNGILAENLNSINTGSSPRQSMPKEAIASEKKSEIQHDGSSHIGSDPTLDRINLESWEATSEKSAGRETNLLLAFFKAFITAFVKFWSE